MAHNRLLFMTVSVGFSLARADVLPMACAAVAIDVFVYIFLLLLLVSLVHCWMICS